MQTFRPALVPVCDRLQSLSPVFQGETPFCNCTPMDIFGFTFTCRAPPALRAISSVLGYSARAEFHPCSEVPALELAVSQDGQKWNSMGFLNYAANVDETAPIPELPEVVKENMDATQRLLWERFKLYVHFRASLSGTLQDTQLFLGLDICGRMILPFIGESESLPPAPTQSLGNPPTTTTQPHTHTHTHTRLPHTPALYRSPPQYPMRILCYYRHLLCSGSGHL